MPSQLEELQTRLDDLTKRHRSASSKKSKLEGQLEAKRQELANLAEEIRQAGYDPKKLKDERDRVAKELVGDMDAFERDMVEVEQALAAFDS